MPPHRRMSIRALGKVYSKILPMMAMIMLMTMVMMTSMLTIVEVMPMAMRHLVL